MKQITLLQDFEGITPNLMAKTMETVEGSGIIIFLLRSMESLRQIHSMAMVSCFDLCNIFLIITIILFEQFLFLISMLLKQL